MRDLLVLAGTIALAASCATAPRKPEPRDRFPLDPREGLSGPFSAQIDAGSEALLAHDAARARAEFSRSVPSKRGLAERIGLIEALVMGGAVEEARSECREALASGEATVPLLVACGEARARSGEALGAFELYRQASTRAPDRSGLRARAEELKSGAVQELLGTARDAEREKSWKTALEAALRAIEIDPDGAAPRIAAAEIELADGKKAAAAERYREALERDPNDRGLREKVATVALEAGDYGLAIAELDRLAADDPRFQDRAEEARLSFRVSNWPAAEREAARSSRLTRAEAARLVWWMVPEVREAKVTSGVIASDVLGRRDSHEIMRALSLGLLDVDRDTHRARPDAPLTASAAARLSLRLLRILRPGEPPKCLADQPDGRTGGEAIRLATECGFFPANPRSRGGVAGADFTRALDRVRAAATGEGRPDEKVESGDGRT